MTECQRRASCLHRDTAPGAMGVRRDYQGPQGSFWGWLMCSLAWQWQFCGYMYVKRLHCVYLKYGNQLAINGNRSSVCSYTPLRHERSTQLPWKSRKKDGELSKRSKAWWENSGKIELSSCREWSLWKALINCSRKLTVQFKPAIYSTCSFPTDKPMFNHKPVVRSVPEHMNKVHTHQQKLPL